MIVELNLISANFNSVRLGNKIIYFSYRTIIAVNNDGKLLISENVWSKTTGKHLNWINNYKSIRLDNETFNKKVDKLLSKL